MPKVSVVMAVYNAERFLERAVRSILDQTFKDLELICVNDGSTDGSLAILERLAADDSRVRIITQENGGEGTARVTGFEAVQGEWLYSIDSDDYALPTLIERCLIVGETERADMVICGAGMEEHATGEVVTCERAFNPSHEVGQAIIPREYGPTLFDDFECWVWNKMFRMSFIKAKGIIFYPRRRIADLSFTYSAMAAAERIALVPEELYHYRVNLPTSAFMNMDASPLDFYNALTTWQEYLIDNGLFDTYRESFITRSMHEVYSSTTVCRNPVAFATILAKLQEEGFERLLIKDAKREDAYSLEEFDLCSFFITHSFDECAFYLLDIERKNNSVFKAYASGLRLGQADLMRQVDDLWKKVGQLEGAEAMYVDLAYSRKNLLKQIAKLTWNSLAKG